MILTGLLIEIKVYLILIHYCDFIFSKLDVDYLLIFCTNYATVLIHVVSVWNIDFQQLSWEAFLKVIFLDGLDLAIEFVVTLVNVWARDQLWVDHWVQLYECIVWVNFSDQVAVHLGVEAHQERAALLESVLRATSGCHNNLISNHEHIFKVEVLNFDVFGHKPSPLVVWSHVSIVSCHFDLELVLVKVNLNVHSNCLTMVSKVELLGNHMELWKFTSWSPCVLLVIQKIISS